MDFVIGYADAFAYFIVLFLQIPCYLQQPFWRMAIRTQINIMDCIVLH